MVQVAARVEVAADEAMGKVPTGNARASDPPAKAQVRWGATASPAEAQGRWGTVAWQHMEANFGRCAPHVQGWFAKGCNRIWPRGPRPRAAPRSSGTHARGAAIVPVRYPVR